MMSCPTSSTSRSAGGAIYGDVSPLHGVILGGARHKLAVGVSVVPLDPAEWELER
jgi:hypothetical protein